MKEARVSDFVEPALYLSPRQSLDQVLPLLRSRADHMAVVVNELVKAIGILTMEDIFEEVDRPGRTRLRRHESPPRGASRR